MPNLPLHEFAAEYRRINDLLYDSAAEDGQIPEECMVVAAGINTTLAEKVENCCKARTEIAGVLEAFKAEEKRIASRRKALEARVEWWEEYIRDSLELAGRTVADPALVAGTFRVKLAKCPPKLEIFDPELVPSDYDKLPAREISTTAVKDAIAAGVLVPGARIVQGTRLSIK